MPACRFTGHYPPSAKLPPDPTTPTTAPCNLSHASAVAAAAAAEGTLSTSATRISDRDSSWRLACNVAASQDNRARLSATVACGNLVVFTVALLTRDGAERTVVGPRITKWPGVQSYVPDMQRAIEAGGCVV